MKFARWIVFVAFFALAENVLVPETQLNERDITYPILSKLTYLVANYIGTEEGNATHKEEIDGNVINATALITRGYAEQQFWPQNNFQVEMHLNVSLNMFLRDFNHHFITEVFPVDIGVRWNNNTAKIHFPDAENLDLKLLPNDYQYKPNEEEKVKQTIKYSIKNILKKFADGGEYLKSLIAGIQFIEADNSRQLSLLSKNPGYSLGTISTNNNYTLNNLTIYGLRHVQSISYNSSNLEVSPKVVIGNVTGSLVQKFHSKADEPLELSLKVNYVRISINQKADFKVNVQFSEYKLKNTKTNLFLGDDESKFIVEDIEFAIAASSIMIDWKRYTQLTFESIQKLPLNRRNVF